MINRKEGLSQFINKDRYGIIQWIIYFQAPQLSVNLIKEIGDLNYFLKIKNQKPSLVFKILRNFTHFVNKCYEVQRQLKRCKKPEWEDTLFGQIQMKFEKEYKNKGSEHVIKQENYQNTKDRLNTKNNQILINSPKLNTNNEQHTPKSEQLQSFFKQIPNNQSINNHAQQQIPEIKPNQKYKKQNSIIQSSRRNSQISGGGLDRSIFQFLTTKNIHQGNVFSQNQTLPAQVAENQTENNNKNGIFFQNQAQGNEELQEEGEGVESFQGQFIDEQCIPIPNKKYSVKLITFFLNDYFTVISIQKDLYREKYQQIVEENKRTSKILDSQFHHLNQISVKSYKIIKKLIEVYYKQCEQSKENQLKLQDDKKLLNSLLYSGYTIKHDVYNIFEWLNRKKNIYKENISKIDINEELHGMAKVFERLLQEQQIKLNILVTLQALQIPLFTDERILSQILYNIMSYCIQVSVSNSDISIAVSQSLEQSDKLIFSIIFKPSAIQNLSLLNYAELKEDNQEHYQEIINIKICKHLLKFISPTGRIQFKLIEDNQIEIKFKLETQSSINNIVNTQIENKVQQNRQISNSNSQQIQAQLNQYSHNNSPKSSPSNSFYISNSQKKINQKQQKNFQETIQEQANSSSINSPGLDNRLQQQREIIKESQSKENKSSEYDKSYKLSQFYSINSKKNEQQNIATHSSNPLIEDQMFVLSQQQAMQSIQFINQEQQKNNNQQQIHSQLIDKLDDKLLFNDSEFNQKIINLANINIQNQSNIIENYSQIDTPQLGKDQNSKKSFREEKQNLKNQEKMASLKQEEQIQFSRNINKYQNSMRSMDQNSMDSLQEDIGDSSKREIQLKQSQLYSTKGIKDIINQQENNTSIIQQDLQYRLFNSQLSNNQENVTNTNVTNNHLMKSDLHLHIKNEEKINSKSFKNLPHKQKDQNYQIQKMLYNNSPRKVSTQQDIFDECDEIESIDNNLTVSEGNIQVEDNIYYHQQLEDNENNYQINSPKSKIQDE